MNDLDLRHLPCPGPVMELKRALEAGELHLRLWVADEQARSNVTRFASSRQASTEVEADPAGGFRVTVTASAASAQAPAGGDAPTTCALPEAPAEAGAMVLQISGDSMGQGDAELGALLLRSFLKTAANLDPPPKAALFYNGGVRLCCAGSTLIADLQALEARGCEVLACGTCLNFFGLAGQLAVGRVTDMLEIVERLAGAARVLRP